MEIKQQQSPYTNNGYSHTQIQGEWVSGIRDILLYHNTFEALKFNTRQTAYAHILDPYFHSDVKSTVCRNM